MSVLTSAARAAAGAARTSARRAVMPRAAVVMPIRQLSDALRASIDEKVTEPLVVFMKGTPDMPQCGYSRAVCQLLEMHGVDLSSLSTYNVLEDMELREGIKEYSEWPTVPQVYIKGEFIGGCDIMIELHQNGELADELKAIGHQSTFTGSGEA